MFRLVLSASSAATLALASGDLKCYIDKDGSGNGSTCRETTYAENGYDVDLGNTVTAPCMRGHHVCIEAKGDKWNVGWGCGASVINWRAIMMAGNSSASSERVVNDVITCDTDLCNGPCSGDIALLILMIIGIVAGACCCCCACLICLFFAGILGQRKQTIIVRERAPQTTQPQV